MPASRASASSRTRLSTWQATSAVFRLTCKSENTTHDWTPCQCVPAGTSACKSMWGRALSCWPDALSPGSSDRPGAACFLGRLFLLAVSRSAAGCSEAPLLSADAAQSLLSALRSGAGFFLGRPGLLTGLDSSAGCSAGSVLAAGLAAAASKAFFLAQTLIFLGLADEIWRGASPPCLLVSTGLPRCAGHTERVTRMCGTEISEKVFTLNLPFQATFCGCRGVRALSNAQQRLCSVAIMPHLRMHLCTVLRAQRSSCDTHQAVIQLSSICKIVHSTL